jgi:PAS domain S-box-containing protein
MFQYISDIHLEYLTYIPYIKKTADNIFLVGDIGHPGTPLFDKFINYCSSIYKNVFIVYGNHEYYSVLRGKNKRIITMQQIEKQARFPTNVYFLNNSHVYFNIKKETVKYKLLQRDNIKDYIKIIGSTLWSDKDPIANNFKYIFITENQLLTYEYQSKLYKKSVDYIVNEIKSEKIECILLSHYSTHKSCIGKYIDHKDANNIDELFKMNNLLCCINGHTHTSINLTVPGTNIKLLANCYGYRGEPSVLVKYNENIYYTLDTPRQTSFNGIYGDGINYIELLYNIINRKDPKFDLGIIDQNSAFNITNNDRDNKIIYANKAFEELTEYKLEEIIGKNCRFLQGKNEIVNRGSNRTYCDNILLYNVKQNIINKNECQFITKNFTKSGEEFINIVTIIPFEWNGIHHFIGFQKNVTEYVVNANFYNIYDMASMIDIYILFHIFIKNQSNIEYLLNNPDQKLFNSIEYLLCMKNKQTGDLILNKSFLNKLGYTLEEINKKSLLEYVHEEDIHIKNNALKKAYNNEYVRVSCRFYKKDKTIVELLWTVMPHNEYCFSIIQDITKKIKTNTSNTSNKKT